MSAPPHVSDEETPARSAASRTVTVIVPTRNEAGNVGPLVARLATALSGVAAEVLFVDDSDDDTPRAVLHAARRGGLPVRLIHRTHGAGGLSGAVVAGLTASRARWCVVMDGDLQHPPELIPALLARGEAEEAEVVVASRHRAGGSSSGLDGWLRHAVSRASTLVTRGMFPRRLHGCTDPMSGFFAVRRASLNLGDMRPRGFKVLLEILTHHRFRIAEEPFVFGVRSSGSSKAGAGNGLQFLVQLAVLRFGRLSKFGMIGAFGAVMNLAIMAWLMWAGTGYLVAAIVGGAVTIVMNFVLQEWLVFKDLRHGRHGFAGRFARSVGFDTAETAVRTGVLWLLVRFLGFHSILAQALLLCVGFLARFVYRSLVVYRQDTAEPLTLLPDGLPVPEEAAPGD
ncbi:MAG TPA: glycosyltransferase [Microbacteriaceae bacterium]|nr:glycosyltransferase [Microbacteriaceae bacterium]